MTDEEIVKAVRSGGYGLVPMPGDGRKFFVGYVKDMDVSDDPCGLFLTLNPDNGECEDMIGVMMGGLTSCAMSAGQGAYDDNAPF